MAIFIRVCVSLATYAHINIQLGQLQNAIKRKKERSNPMQLNCLMRILMLIAPSFLCITLQLITVVVSSLVVSIGNG